MSGISKPVNRGTPCPICGKTDWCNIITYPSGDEVFACHRAEGSKGDTATGADGRIYRCTGETIGGFTKWQELSQYEKFIEKLKAESGKSGKGNYKKSYSSSSVKAAYSPKYEDIPVKGVATLASPERLDLVNRAFLSLLILETKHEAKLRLEWDKEVEKVNIYNLIMKTWPILSIPPEDFIRFSSLERLNNLSRKKIMEKLIELVGEPLGVPGFYQKKDGTWTFYRLSGIVFPAYNSKGQMIRLRVNDDYPLIDAELDGRAGVFHYQKDENGVVGWYFIPQDQNRLAYDKAELVWSFGSPQSRFTLNEKGYPPGKVKGKYKNFSSYSEKLVEENGKKYRLNTLTNGCQSGSSTSLYTKPGDDMDLVYITEGEKKAIVANAILNAPVISLPGVASYEKVFENEEGYDTSLMDELKKKGMELAVLIFDADKNENEKVMNSEKKAVAEFLKGDIPIAIGEWNENWGKGLDDVLLKGVKPRIMVIS